MYAARVINLAHPSGQFLVFKEDFRGGIEIATADTNNDGREEIIVGLGSGTIPGIRIYDVFGHFKTQFFAYNINFRGGIRLTAKDLDNDGIKEIITTPGQGGGPHVRIFDINGRPIMQFFAFNQTDRGGLFVAAGDTDNDGDNELITHTGIIYSWNGSSFINDYNIDLGNSASDVLISDIDNDGLNEIIAVYPKPYNIPSEA